MSKRNGKDRIPNIKQRDFLNAMTTLINVVLDTWPRASGKTWVREELCRRIMEDDVNPRPR